MNRPPIPPPPGYDPKVAAERRKKAQVARYKAAARGLLPAVYVTRGIRYRPGATVQSWSVTRSRHGDSDVSFFDTKVVAIAAALAMASPAMTTVLDIALDDIARGWSPIPIPYCKKNPGRNGWQHLRITAADAASYFNGALQNIGVLLGEASNGLADIDLDTPEAIAVAPYLLPSTAIFGRASKRHSHYLYVAPGLAEVVGKAVLKFRDPTLPRESKPLLELRVGGEKGAQTVFPPSAHEDTGEPIAWERSSSGPITIGAAEPRPASSGPQRPRC